MKHLAWFFIAIIFAAACTNNEQFRVNGTIEGNPTINLRVGYYADGAYQTVITAAREGKFEFYGSSKTPTIVDILDYDYRPLARIYAANGETFEIHLDRDNLFDTRISGNDVSRRWADFIRDNKATLRAGNPDSINVLVADYVSRNPADVLSTILMVTAFRADADAFAADSVMNLIDPHARPSALTESFNFMLRRLIADVAADTIAPVTYAGRRDSVRIFDPTAKRLSLIVFDENGRFRDDSIVPLLNKLNKQKSLQIVEFDLGARANILHGRSDTIPWPIGRIPGAFAGAGIEHLAIPATPYFIVTDSAGAQLFRTPSPGKAAAFIKNF